MDGSKTNKKYLLNNRKILIISICSVFLLLIVGVLGVNFSSKGTTAATTVDCPGKTIDGYCCGEDDDIVLYSSIEEQHYCINTSYAAEQFKGAGISNIRVDIWKYASTGNYDISDMVMFTFNADSYAAAATHCQTEFEWEEAHANTNNDFENEYYCGSSDLGGSGIYGTKVASSHVIRYYENVDNSGDSVTNMPDDHEFYYHDDFQCSISDKVPERENYIFKGWGLSADTSTVVFEAGAGHNCDDMFYEDDMDLYAVWEYDTSELERTVKFYTDNGQPNDAWPASQTVLYGREITLPSLTKSTFCLEGWFTGTNGTGTKVGEEGDKYKVTDNITLYSYFKTTGTCSASTETWTATFYDDTSKTNKIGTDTCEKTASESGCYVDVPTAPTKEGYTFGGWHSSSSPDECLTSSTLKIYVSSASWYACWTENATDSDSGDDTENTHSIYFYTEGGEVYIGDTWQELGRVVVNDGESFALPNAKRDGYVFLGWYYSSTSDIRYGGSGTTYTPNSNMTMYARWGESTATSDDEEVDITETHYPITYDARPGELYIDDEWVSIINDYVVKGESTTLPAVTRSGYTFLGWYTATTGGTRVGGANTTYTPTENITLYAQWSEMPATDSGNDSVVSYTISYNANGGSGAPNSQNKVHDRAISLSTVKPIRSGYTFVNWNTKSDGSGVSYNPGVTYTSNSNLTLYAQWSAITATPDDGSSTATSDNSGTGGNAEYLVKYDANGGSGAPSNQVKKHGVTLTLSAVKPTRSGYTFVNWNTKSDGSGTSYGSGASYTANAYVTLYAQWSAITATPDDGSSTATSDNSGTGGNAEYLVKYDANGGSGAPSNQVKKHGVTLTLSAVKPTRSGYTFVNWNTKKDGSGTSYGSGASYTANAYVTLYAQWNAIPDDDGSSVTPGDGEVDITETHYPITYDARPGKLYIDDEWVSIINDYVEKGKSTKLPSVSRTGYTFLGWYTSTTGGTRVGGADTTYTPTENITLYARWEAIEGAPSDDEENEPEISKVKYLATLDANGGTLTGSSSLSCSTDTSSCNIVGLPTAKKSGYTFTGWGTSSSCTSGEKSSLTLNTNKKYYACYTKNASGGNNPSVDEEGNVTDNVQTGDIAIAIACIIALAAVGYSLYYYKNVKQH